MKQLPNINFLRYFYSAGKQRSMSKAAKENFVTQSAISQGIDKLETELGKQLVSNRKNRFELTSDGELLLEKCESIFAQFADIEDLFNDKIGVYQGKFHFATSHSFALTLLPGYYKELFQKHSSVEPILRLGHAGIVRDWISRGEIEFGVILAKPADFLEFNTQLILEGKHAVFKAKKGTESILDRLMISQDSLEDHQLIEKLKEKEQKIPPLVEILSWEVIARMIEQGLGMGMLPEYVAERHHLIPAFKAYVTYRLIAIWSKKKKLSRNARMFIDFMRDPKQ